MGLGFAERGSGPDEIVRNRMGYRADQERPRRKRRGYGDQRISVMLSAAKHPTGGGPHRDAYRDTSLRSG